MSDKKQKKPDLDAICGQAAWMLAQVMAMRLVQNGIVAKDALQADVVAAISACRHDPAMNESQREARQLLAQLHTNLDYADEKPLN